MYYLNRLKVRVLLEKLDNPHRLFYKLYRLAEFICIALTFIISNKNVTYYGKEIYTDSAGDRYTSKARWLCYIGMSYHLVDTSSWATKTPNESIRRIVQNSNEIFRIQSGLWALEEFRAIREPF